MAGTIELSIWIAVDALGEYAVATNEDDLAELILGHDLDPVRRVVHHIVLECPAVDFAPHRTQIGARVLRLVKDE